jgi:ATP-dependent Clp protease, protease subunit
MRTTNLNPIFFEKTKDGEKIYDVSSRLIKDRVIFLDCEIDEEVTSQITSLIFLLDRENTEAEIKLWINSPGGLAQGFFAIYDMIQRVKAPVKTVCVGEASSAAAILLASGSSGLRYAMPNSRIMIHQIQVDGITGSNAEVEIDTKELKALQNRLTEILARHTGHTTTKIKRDTKMNKYMSASEALEYGLIDKILPTAKKQPELIKKEYKTSNTIRPEIKSESEDDEE